MRCMTYMIQQCTGYKNMETNMEILNIAWVFTQCPAIPILWVAGFSSRVIVGFWCYQFGLSEYIPLNHHHQSPVISLSGQYYCYPQLVSIIGIISCGIIEYILYHVLLSTLWSLPGYLTSFTNCKSALSITN